MYKPKLIIKILGPGEAFTGNAFNYFNSGVMESEGTYLNGKKDGPWIRWYKNKKAEANGLPHDKKLLKEDEKFLRENPDLEVAKPTQDLKVDKDYNPKWAKA